MKFQCVGKGETWEGVVTRRIAYENCLEIMIESRSSLMVILGKTSRGGFACIPDFGAGCHLVDFKNYFWNTEKLTEILGEADGITVGAAIYVLADSMEDST
jgi:hypothetical protein